MGLAPLRRSQGREASLRRAAGSSASDPARPLRLETRAPGCPENYCPTTSSAACSIASGFDAIAGGVQKFTEAVLLEWVQSAIRATGIHRLALGGGVFMNVKANKLIMELPEVQELSSIPRAATRRTPWGPPRSCTPSGRGRRRDHAARRRLLGPGVHERRDRDGHPGLRVPRGRRRRPARARRAAGRPACSRRAPSWPASRAARSSAARSLGNRAILANPSETGVIREINEAIKAREFWMPFAPSVLSERCARLLVNPSACRRRG